MSNLNEGIFHGLRRITLRVRDLMVDGQLPGAPLGLRLRGATASGAPAAGTWRAGDVIVDRTGNIFTCTANGTPGTWANAGNLYLPLTGGSLSGALTISSGNMVVSFGNVQVSLGGLSMFGNLDITNAGSGLKVKEGSNAKQGASALTSGAVTVANTSVTSTSGIVCGMRTPGGTPGAPFVPTVTTGTSFVIHSTSATDSSTVFWEIFEQG